MASRRWIDPVTVCARRCLPLTEEFKEKIFEIAQALPDETDWLRVKRPLLLLFSPADRQLFSRRDEATKRHPPFNQFEAMVRTEWRRLTGKTLTMPADKMMDDVDPDRYL